MMIENVAKRYYEVFEIHKLPRGLVLLTLRIKFKNVTQMMNGRDRKLPEGTLTIHIGDTETIPDNANFIRTINVGFNTYRYSITSSFKTIHKRIVAIKDALNHSNLQLFKDGKEYKLDKEVTDSTKESTGLCDKGHE